MISKIPKPFRNFYFVCSALFLGWMMFLDSNNLISRFQLTTKLNSLENEKEYYQQKIGEVEQDRQELFGDADLVEKFAREKYLMKKPTEDIFVIVDE